MFKFEAAKLPAILDAWSKHCAVWVPTNTSDDPIPGRWQGQTEQMLLPHEYINFSMSLKTFVFEESESLFSWQDQRKTGQAASQPFPQDYGMDKLLFGVRPCDCHGLAFMQQFFMAEYTDINFQLRWQHIYVVGINCLKPGESCFCDSLGTGPFAKPQEQSGCDLLLTPDENWFLVDAITTKGKSLLTQIASFLHQDLDDITPQRLLELEMVAKAQFTSKLATTNLNEVLDASYNDPIWEKLATSCIACTGCTRVCPTCTCFSTDEEQGKHQGVRMRVWDSCQSRSFTRNAEWHNPRKQSASLRYRIYDKLKYINDRFNILGCSGCGRCSQACPACINMVDVVNELTAKYIPGSTPPSIPVPYRQEARSFDPQLYTPLVAQLVEIFDETRDIRKFTVRYYDRPDQGTPALRGQFFMLTVFGVGEIAISVPFTDKIRDNFTFYVKKVGKVTTALHKLQVGDVIGLRGPFGVPFPYDTFKGKDLLVVGSGVGLAPVRAVLARAVENKQDFGRIVIMASASSYQGLLLKEDLINWAQIPGVSVFYSLSKPTDKVQAHIGYINDLLPALELDWQNTTAIICASARRIKAVAKDLMRLGLTPSNIYTALETNMRCGVGKCGHCKVGSHYMCIDGPVFTYEQMLQLPPEF